MRIKKRILRKIISVFATVLLLLNSFTPYLLITPIVRSVSAQVEITPTSANEASAEEVPTVIPTTEPTTEPTVEVTPVETITPTEIPTLEPTEAPSVPSPPLTTATSSEVITPTPTESPILLSKEGIVETTVVELYSCRADSINGCLVTDKADYTPTEAAVITGHGFLATTIYTIKISSTDEPAVNFEKEITTNEEGSFTYSYQLDGNYRPNYLVELKDSLDQLVASVTFTDTDTVNSPPSFDAIVDQNVNRNSSSQDVMITTVSPGPGETGQTVTMTATSSNPTIIPNPSVSASGETRTLTYTPAVDQLGSVTIMVTADDGQSENNTFSRTFTITVNEIDTTSPVITVLGDDPVTVEINSSYTDAGSTAIDNLDGDISAQIFVNDLDVDTSQVGTYTVYFDVEDSSNNSADQKTRTVNVVDTIAETFTAISNALYDDYYINNNLDQVNTNNVTSFFDLFFEKQDENGDPFGRITFYNGLDLTDSETLRFLQDLGNYLDMNEGRIALNATNSELFAATGATLEVYFMPEVTESNLIVRDDSGNFLNKEDIVSNFTYDSGSETATFDTAHFTQFDFDTTEPNVTSAETQDGDGDGYIDGIKLTFSEDIDDSLLNPGTSDGWDVDGYDGESIGTGSVENDNILILSFDEGTSYDVNLTPIVMYSRLLETRSTHDLAGNQLNDYSASSTDKSAPTVPTADPVGGDYTADQSVTLTGESGAEIRYTTDGTTPTDSTGTVYSSPILIDVDTVLKAIAIDPSGNVSQVMTETYGIAPLISGETSSSATSDSVTITWTTDDPSTSRVVYDTVSHSLGAGSNYGYANSTVEDPTKVTSHSVDLTGLTAGATYYYRTVSHGSPESVSDEKTFATTTISSTTSDGGGSVAGASAPVCNEAKPGSAPILLSAVAGLNSVTLNWTKAKDPVSYYLVTFGTKSGEQLYGNPNVGDSNTTAYTINNLSGGKTYYFKVRAGNGCMPGDFSNEKSGSPSGGFIEGIPGGFASGVLGIQDQITPTGVSEGKVPPSLAPNSNTTSPRLGFFQLIWNFILGLFRK